MWGRCGALHQSPLFRNIHLQGPFAEPAFFFFFLNVLERKRLVPSIVKQLTAAPSGTGGAEASGLAYLPITAIVAEAPLEGDPVRANSLVFGEAAAKLFVDVDP